MVVSEKCEVPVRSRWSWLVVAGLLLFALLPVPRVQGWTGEPPHAFLARILDLSSGDLRKVQDGRAVSHTLEAASNEVAVVGIVRMALSADFYVSRLRDIAAFKRSDTVQQIGTFSAEPQPGDLRDLTLDPGDLRDLRECRQQECGLQLPASVIEQIGTKVDWRSPQADAQASDIFRTALVDYVRRYRASRGLEPMVYANERDPVHVGVSYRAILDSERDILPEFPSIRQYLLAPSSTSRPDAVADLIYWSKENVSSRSAISVTHMTIFRTSAGPAEAYLATSRQLYASRYFDASLGMTLLLQDPQAAHTYVVYANRTHTDAFGGILGGIARRVVRSRVRSGAADMLERVKVRLERDFAENAARADR